MNIEDCNCVHKKKKLNVFFIPKNSFDYNFRIFSSCQRYTKLLELSLSLGTPGSSFCWEWT